MPKQYCALHFQFPLSPLVCWYRGGWRLFQFNMTFYSIISNKALTSKVCLCSKSVEYQTVMNWILSRLFGSSAQRPPGNKGKIFPTERKGKTRPKYPVLCFCGKQIMKTACELARYNAPLGVQREQSTQIRHKEICFARASFIMKQSPF